MEKQFPDGIYYGDLVDGKKHGKGKMIYNSGKVYEGEWKDGKKYGHGVMKYNNGDVYEGEWKNNKRNGEGTLTHKDGKEEKGIWTNDVIKKENSKSESENIKIEEGIVEIEKTELENIKENKEFSNDKIKEENFIECPKCKELNQSNVFYCKVCGARLSGKSKDTYVQNQRTRIKFANNANGKEFIECPKCGETNLSSSIYCKICGANLTLRT